MNLGPYTEICLRCASRINGGEDAEYRRCLKVATHRVDGWALCAEHAEGKRGPRPHRSAVKLDRIYEYLDRLDVPGLCPLLPIDDGEAKEIQPCE